MGLPGPGGMPRLRVGYSHGRGVAGASRQRLSFQRPRAGGFLGCRPPDPEVEVRLSSVCPGRTALRGLFPVVLGPGASGEAWAAGLERPPHPQHRACDSWTGAYHRGEAPPLGLFPCLSGGSWLGVHPYTPPLLWAPASTWHPPPLCPVPSDSSPTGVSRGGTGPLAQVCQSGCNG